MINSYKNFERLRYRIFNDMKDIYLKNKERSDDIKVQISNTIFATIFSAFITEVAFRNIDLNKNLISTLLLIFIFVFLYIISYISYNKIFNKIILFNNKTKLGTIDTSVEKMIQIQKDFDNIACDSILLCKNYKVEFENLISDEDNRNLKIMYYYEIMHYLDTACEKTFDLVKNKNDCIRTLDKALGVDIFRVINLINIVKELETFLDINLNYVLINNNQNEAINFQLTSLKGKIRNIDELIN